MEGRSVEQEHWQTEVAEAHNAIRGTTFDMLPETSGNLGPALHAYFL